MLEFLHFPVKEPLQAVTGREDCPAVQYGRLMAPLYIQVDARDNVAIIVNPEGLPAGTSFRSGLALMERIPQSHKVALRPIESGEPIVRYGQIIGLAARAIGAGAWVREELVQLPKAPPLDQ